MRTRKRFTWLLGLAAFALVACSSKDDPAPVEPIDDNTEVDGGHEHDASLDSGSESDDDGEGAGDSGVDETSDAGNDVAEDSQSDAGEDSDNDASDDPASDAGDGDPEEDASTDPDDANSEPEIIGSDPGRRWCGDKGACGLNQACCFKDGTYTCNSPAPPPKGWNCQLGNIFLCDESADCTESNPLCCVGQPSPGYATSCESSCEAAGRVQLCRTHEECENGEPCTPQVCNGMTIQACGALPDEFCP